MSSPLSPLDAITPDFLVRLFFGIVVYWAIGIISEGIVKPIQKNLAERFIKKTSSTLTELERYADQSCSQIDDLLIGVIAPIYRDFCGLVLGSDLPPASQQLYRQLVTERYQFPILLKKLLNHVHRESSGSGQVPNWD